MTLVVLDTNVLVSSLWSKDGVPSKIFRMVLESVLTPCHDYRIINEYNQVLRRSKFHFSASDVEDMLDYIVNRGHSIVASAAECPFADESDRKFYEVAASAGAILITGNIRHYPVRSFIMSPAGFLEMALSSA